MTGTINNGERLAAAFSFFTGECGVVRRPGEAEAMIAIRNMKRTPRVYEAEGLVGDQPVEILTITKSRVTPNTIVVVVRFLATSA